MSNFEDDVDIGQFWWEQYPKLSELSANLIESERARMTQEIFGGGGVPEDEVWYKDARINQDKFDHAVFALLLTNGLARHVNMLDQKQAEKWRGRYDVDYGNRCRAYEALIRDGQEIRRWLGAIPDHDMNLIPEPAIVSMLFAGLLDNEKTGYKGQGDDIVKHLARFRTPQPKKPKNNS
jgi:hypothetical protein